MTQFLNNYDKALHDAIYEEMLKTDPARLFLNPRLKILKIVQSTIGSPFGVIADVGCGSGYFGIFLATQTDQIKYVDAIEASEAAVKEVIPRNAEFHNVLGKVKPIFGSFDELAKETYDFVFAMGALHHSPDLKKTLEVISQSLKKGGYLIAQEPAMPDSTSHEAYDFKYNIVEERFGLKIRNGDRFDRFYRECEYKSSLVHAGFDILLWDDFVGGIKKSAVLAELFKSLVFSIKRDGLNSTLQRFLRNYRGTQKVGPDSPDWQSDMKNATSKVMPKMTIARKSSACNTHHAE